MLAAATFLDPTKCLGFQFLESTTNRHRRVTQHERKIRRTRVLRVSHDEVPQEKGLGNR